MDRGRWIVEQQGGLAWWAPLSTSTSLGRVSPSVVLPGPRQREDRRSSRASMADALDDRCVEVRVGQVDCSTSTLSRDAVCRMPMCLKGWQSGWLSWFGSSSLRLWGGMLGKARQKGKASRARAISQVTWTRVNTAGEHPSLVGLTLHTHTHAHSLTHTLCLSCAALRWVLHMPCAPCVVVLEL